MQVGHGRRVGGFEELPQARDLVVELADDGFVAPLQHVWSKGFDIAIPLFEGLRVALRQTLQRRAQHHEGRGAERLHAAAEQHVTRVAQAQDDARVRKQPHDHRQAPHVEWILVYQAASTQIGQYAADQPPISVAQLIRVFLAQARQILRIALTNQLHAFDQIMDVGTLVHGLEIWVRIEHLLQQCGARAREADHEDWASLCAG